MMRQLRTAALLGCAFLATGCLGGGIGLDDLAQRPPLPYSIVVTGGAFVEPGPRSPTVPPLQRTFRPDVQGAEAFSLESVVDALQTGRVFVRVSQDDARSVEERLALARSRETSTDDPGLVEYLREQRLAGHDFILVVESVEDGPVEYRGVNGQWPITATVWLMVGLGVLIPDHTYESTASMRISLRDVETGRRVFERVLSGGPVNLPLVQRTGVLGLLISIIVPPFWVGSDDEDVETTVRNIASARLVTSMARQLKTVDVQTRVTNQMPAQLEMELVEGGVRVRVQAEESLSFVRMRLDEQPVGGAAFTQFENELLSSGVPEGVGGRLVYEGVLVGQPRGERLQLLVQTVTGRVASMTIGIGK